MKLPAKVGSVHNREVQEKPRGSNESKGQEKMYFHFFPFLTETIMINMKLWIAFFTFFFHSN